ncbi:MAG: hypothetical protein Q4P25_05615 [Tissierellia bacterium]|nr:hypothetical protein [Tissierellia bacterium]
MDFLIGESSYKRWAYYFFPNLLCIDKEQQICQPKAVAQGNQIKARIPQFFYEEKEDKKDTKEDASDFGSGRFCSIVQIFHVHNPEFDSHKKETKKELYNNIQRHSIIIFVKTKLNYFIKPIDQNEEGCHRGIGYCLKSLCLSMWAFICHLTMILGMVTF